MCDGCEDKEGLLIPQLDPLPIDQSVALFAPRPPTRELPRGLHYFNESRSQRDLEGDGG